MCAIFSPEILQAGAAKGLKSSKSCCKRWVVIRGLLIYMEMRGEGFRIKWSEKKGGHLAVQVAFHQVLYCTACVDVCY